MRANDFEPWLRLRKAKRREERKAKLNEYAKKVRDVDQLLEDIQREFPKKWALFPYCKYSSRRKRCCIIKV